MPEFLTFTHRHTGDKMLVPIKGYFDGVPTYDYDTATELAQDRGWGRVTHSENFDCDRECFADDAGDLETYVRWVKPCL